MGRAISKRPLQLVDHRPVAITAERMRPAYLARFGVDLGDAHEAAGGSEDYRLMPAARRFDLGNHNYPAVLAAEQSLAILNRIGHDNTDDAAIPALSARIDAGGVVHTIRRGMIRLATPRACDRVLRLTYRYVSCPAARAWPRLPRHRRPDPQRRRRRPRAVLRAQARERALVTQ